MAQKLWSAAAHAHCTKKKAVIIHWPSAAAVSVWSKLSDFQQGKKQNSLESTEINVFVNTSGLTRIFLMTWSLHPHISDTFHKTIMNLKPARGWNFTSNWKCQSNIGLRWSQALWRRSGSHWSRKQYLVWLPDLAGRGKGDDWTQTDSVRLTVLKKRFFPRSPKT